MFVDLGTFIKEKELYNQKVNELKNTILNPEELSKALDEEKLKFKGITRKYLPTALSVIKNTFKCDYSLYKIGRDVDSNFNTIETNVNKTQTEIAAEMNQFVQQANTMGLNVDEVNKLNLSIDVIMNYVDDTAITEDENKAFYLNHSKVVASSLDLPITQKNQEPIVSQTIQYNPYANQPLDFNSQVNSNQNISQSTPSVLVDPFANIYNQQPVMQNNNVSPTVSDNNIFQVPNQQPVIQQPVPSVIPTVPVVTPTVYSESQINYSTSMNESINNATKMPDISLRILEDMEMEKEENGVVAQLVCAVLIPIIVLVCAVIVSYVVRISFINDLLSSLSGFASQLAICLVIGAPCFICSEVIIKIAKNKTPYLERFVLAPILLSLPISWFFLKILTSIQPNSYEDSLKFVLILLLGVIMYFPFCLFLLIKASANRNHEKMIKAPSWSIFDKLGLLMVIYTAVIPAIYVLTSILGVEFMDDIINVIYFLDNPNISKYLWLIFLVVAPILAGLIMIKRATIQKRVGNGV